MLKGHVNKYAILGLVISLGSIIIASILVSYQLTGFIDFPGVIVAQRTNPALWALDLTPFMFAYWGQSFCYELANTMESMLDDKTKELRDKSSDLELKLHYETHHDHLTNLPNQRLLTQRINQGIKQINAGEELAVILLHIRSFKEINQKYGSFNANSLLIQFAERLKTILLEPFLLQAYMGMNMVARLQGAEFALLIPRLRQYHHFDKLLAKILDSTAMNLMIDGHSITIKTTAGVALYPPHGADDSILLQRAGASLFHAEEQGQAFAIYHAGMDKEVNVRRMMITELSNAIDNEDVVIIYQPFLELKKGAIVGMDAQLQFDDPTHGVMNADKLLPLVEGTVLLNKLTFLMAKNAIKQLALWHQANHKIYMTVSIFDATDVELPALVAGLLKTHNIAPEYLKMELTEKACLSDQSGSMVVLKQLAELGIKLVISDFCSGYSSFVYLTNFPISEIKIDKSIIGNMLDNEKQLSVVRAVIKLADAMNLVVFADGIIDEPMVKKLKQLGCLYGQGPYFSQAVSAEEVTAMLDKSPTT